MKGIRTLLFILAFLVFMLITNYMTGWLDFEENTPDNAIISPTMVVITPTQIPPTIPAPTPTPQPTPTIGPDYRAIAERLQTEIDILKRRITELEYSIASGQASLAEEIQLAQLNKELAAAQNAWGDLSANNGKRQLDYDSTESQNKIAETAQVERNNAELDDLLIRLETDRNLEYSWKWLVYSAVALFVFFLSVYVTLRLLKDNREARQPIPAQVMHFEIKQGTRTMRKDWPEKVDPTQAKRWAQAVLVDNDLRHEKWTPERNGFERDRYTELLAFWQACGAIADNVEGAPKQGKHITAEGRAMLEKFTNE